MRFQVVAVVSAAALTSGALLDSRSYYPNCFVDCVSRASTGGCSASDTTCLCKSQEFISAVTSCVQGECDSAAVSTAEEAAQQLCNAVGVTLSNLPTASGVGATSTTTVTSGASQTGSSTGGTGGGAGSSSSGGSGSGAGASASSAVASVTSAASSAAGSITSAASSAASSASSALSSITGSRSSSGSGSSSSGSGTQTASGSSSTSDENAGLTAGISIFAAVAAILGAVAL